MVCSRSYRVTTGALRVMGICCLSLASVTAGCIQQTGEPGPPGGPSELGLSLSLTATPDMLPLDGATRSFLGILARDGNGEPVPNVTLSLQISTARGFEDYGRLSARQVTTGPNGRASATYTAPTASPGPSIDAGEVVTISVTPVDGNFSNAVSRGLTIRLVPTGTIIPPFGVTAGFAFTPEAPTVFNDVLFTTACATATSTDCVRDPAGIVTSYAWDFGDGRAGAGRSASHSYVLAGTYIVKLTIRDAAGRSAEATRAVVVGGGTAPSAVLSVSPIDPKEEDTVFFNASGSTPAPGRTIVSHAWDFGDGAEGSGVTTSHSYGVAGTYTVTLNVTDDRGQVGTATAAVVVSETGPTASFVLSPTDPTVGSTVFFDGHGSEPGPGRTIVTFAWNFGDGAGTSGSGNVSHTYTNAGTYTVLLQVTNDVGETDTASQTVTVAP